MGIFNYYKAKEYGYSDQEIADHLAESKDKFNIGKAREMGFTDKEIIGHLAYDIDPNATTASKVAAHGVSQGFTDILKGINQLEDSQTMVGKFFEPLYKVRNLLAEPVVNAAGAEMPTKEDRKKEQQRNIKDEFLYDLYKDQGYKLEAMGGYAAGTLAQPANWVGGLGGAEAKVIQIAKEGSILGGIQGLINPVYEEDTDGGRLKSTVWGTVTGFALGLGFGKLFESLGARFGKKAIEELADKEGKVTGKTASENVAVKPKEEGTPSTTTNLEEPLVPKNVETANIPTNEGIPGTVPVKDIIDPYDLKFDPKVMGTPKPRQGQYELQFESDLDKALYIIGNRKQLSKADDKFVSWVMENTGLSHGEVLSAASNFKKAKNIEILNDGTAFVHRSNLPDFTPKAPLNQIPTPSPAVVNPLSVPKEQQLATSVSNLDSHTAPFIGKTEGGFDSFPKSWDALDNVSKNLYNIGRKLNEAEALGTKPLINANESLSARKILQEIHPKGTQAEHADMLKTYSDFVDELMKVKGEGFKPPTIPELFIHGVDDLTWQQMAANGTFDGCNFL